MAPSELGKVEQVVVQCTTLQTALRRFFDVGVPVPVTMTLVDIAANGGDNITDHDATSTTLLSQLDCK